MEKENENDFFWIFVSKTFFQDLKINNAYDSFNNMNDKFSPLRQEYNFMYEMKFKVNGIFIV